MLAKQKPAIVFVPSRKQAKITAIDIVTYTAANRTDATANPNVTNASVLKSYKFSHVNPEELQLIVEKMEDKTLKENIINGVAYLPEGTSDLDKSIVEKLFSSGAIQIVLVSRNLCWSLTLEAY